MTLVLAAAAASSSPRASRRRRRHPRGVNPPPPTRRWDSREARDQEGHCDTAQRRAIRKAYADTYDEELLRSITDKISGDLR